MVEEMLAARGICVGSGPRTRLIGQGSDPIAETGDGEGGLHAR